jgi:hypothetical protein
MEKHTKKNTGIRRLIDQYRRVFRIPENLNYYSKADYKIAEKKFLRYALLVRGVNRKRDTQATHDD